jgi:hypothetical protein
MTLQRFQEKVIGEINSRMELYKCEVRGRLGKMRNVAPYGGKMFLSTVFASALPFSGR